MPISPSSVPWKPENAERTVWSHPVGRVYIHEHGPQKGRWFWSMTAHVGHDRTLAKCEGTAGNFDEARALVRTAWEATKTG